LCDHNFCFFVDTNLAHQTAKIWRPTKNLLALRKKDGRNGPTENLEWIVSSKSVSGKFGTSFQVLGARTRLGYLQLTKL
jgi:hypothetical protein